MACCKIEATREDGAVLSKLYGYPEYCCKLCIVFTSWEWDFERCSAVAQLIILSEKLSTHVGCDCVVSLIKNILHAFSEIRFLLKIRQSIRVISPLYSSISPAESGVQPDVVIHLDESRTLEKINMASIRLAHTTTIMKYWASLAIVVDYLKFFTAKYYSSSNENNYIAYQLILLMPMM